MVSGVGSNQTAFADNANPPLAFNPVPGILYASGLSLATGIITAPVGQLNVYSPTSGAIIFNAEGTNGSLFSIVDNLSGSLMSVNNNAGLPVFEVFSDDRVVAGRFGQNDFVMTSGGNVGIGVGSPVSKLQVSGITIINNLTMNSGMIMSSGVPLILFSSGNYPIQRTPDGNTRGNRSTDLQLVRNSPAQVAGGQSSIICGGEMNTASGTYSIVVGGLTNLVNAGSNSSSIVGGASNRIKDSAKSVIVGGNENGINASSYSSILGGSRYWNNYSPYVISSSHSSVVCGGNSRHGHEISNSPASFIGGGGTSIYNTEGGGFGHRIIGSPYSFIGGGGGYPSYHSNYIASYGNTFQALGNGIVCGAKNRVGDSSLYTTFNFIGGGYSNTIGSTNSTSHHTICGGSTNIIDSTSISSIIGGSNNSIYGLGGSVLGGSSNTISQSATYASCIGLSSKARLYGELAHSAGPLNSIVGSAQSSRLVARNTTTSTSATLLYLDGSSIKMTMPLETTWNFNIQLSAYSSTSNAGAAFNYRGAIRNNNASGVILVGSTIEENFKENTLNNVSGIISANDSTDSLDITVYGLASNTIRWVAAIDIAQVSDL
jgi:hypothetical protein